MGPRASALSESLVNRPEPAGKCIMPGLGWYFIGKATRTASLGCDERIESVGVR